MMIDSRTEMVMLITAELDESLEALDMRAAIPNAADRVRMRDGLLESVEGGARLLAEGRATERGLIDGMQEVGLSEAQAIPLAAMAVDLAVYEPSREQRALEALDKIAKEHNIAVLVTDAPIDLEAI